MIKQTILISFILFVAACDKNGNKEVSESNVSNPEFEVSCLQDMANNPCGMLSKEDLVAIAEIPLSNLETDDNSQSKHLPATEYAECQYRWPSERKMTLKVGDREMQADTKNSIVFGHIKVLDDKLAKNETYSSYFQKVYGQKTEQQKAELKRRIDEAAKEDDKVSQSSAKMLNKMLDNEKFTPVENLGDGASWETIKAAGISTVNLHVLHGNVTFFVAVDISENDEEDLKMATMVAKAILARCK